MGAGGGQIRPETDAPAGKSGHGGNHRVYGICTQRLYPDRAPLITGDDHRIWYGLHDADCHPDG
ncbi:hypothetical protein D3C73_1320400 [compost metagenome]